MFFPLEVFAAFAVGLIVLLASIYESMHREDE